MSDQDKKEKSRSERSAAARTAAPAEQEQVSTEMIDAATQALVLDAVENELAHVEEGEHRNDAADEKTHTNNDAGHSNHERSGVAAKVRAEQEKQGDSSNGSVLDSRTDGDNDVSLLPASDVPVPTELHRHESTPGAVGVRGVAASEVSNRVSVTEPPRSRSLENADLEDGPPLLMATLVESDRDMGTSSTAVSAATKQAPLAMAELMEEKKDCGLSILPESRERRRRLLLLLAVIVCCCMLAGIGVGVGVATLRDDDDDDDDRRPPNSEIMRMYYFLQWGSFTAGCKAPHDAPLYLKCDNQGMLEILEKPDGVKCVMEDNKNAPPGKPGAVCYLDDLGYENETKRNRRLRRHIFSSRSYVPSFDQRRVQENDNLSMPGLQISQGRIVAFCEGNLGQGSLILNARVDFEPRFKSNSTLDDESVCSHVWQERQSIRNSTTVDRRYGGGASGFLSSALLCPVIEDPSRDEEELRIELNDVSCATGGGVLVGQLNDTPGNETVPICTLLERCVETAYSCLVNDADNDPCLHANCSVQLLQVQITRPQSSDVRRCSVPADESVFMLPPEIIQTTVEPYILSEADFIATIEPFRKQMESDLW